MVRGVLEVGKLKGLPSDAVPVNGTSGEITTNTAVQILSPSAATKALYISKIVINNKTIGEDAIITIQDDEGTPNVHFRAMVSTNGGNGGNLQLDFDPPFKVVTGADLDGIAPATTGDTIVMASGWEGTPGE